MGPWWLTWHLCLYICEKCEMSRLWRMDGRTDSGKVVQYSVWAESAIHITKLSWVNHLHCRANRDLRSTLTDSQPRSGETKPSSTRLASTTVSDIETFIFCWFYPPLPRPKKSVYSEDKVLNLWPPTSYIWVCLGLFWSTYDLWQGHTGFMCKFWKFQ